MKSAPAIDAPVVPLDAVSDDGTAIRGWVCGSGPHRWLLTPGLGTPLYSWRYLIEHFKARMTIVTWEPRGCYDSARPAGPGRMAVEDHVADGLSVMRTAGFDTGEPFVCGGWSMGIQIGLELYDRMPDRVRGLVLINGAFEHVLNTAFSFPYAGSALECLLKTASAGAPLFAPLSGWLLGRPWTIAVLKRAGLVTANRDFFGEVLSEFRRLDFATYFPLMLGLNRHSARHILPRVRVPTLITAGTKDKMTPLSVAEFVNRQIPGSELAIIEDGTHYTTIEYPDVVNRHLERFFRERVFGDAWEDR